MTTRGSFIGLSAALEKHSRQRSEKVPKTFYDHEAGFTPSERVTKTLLIDLFLWLRRAVFRRQGFRFTAAQLAKEILLGFKRPAGELPLVAMIANLVRTTMAPIAIYDARVRIGYAADPEGNSKRQQKL